MYGKIFDSLFTGSMRGKGDLQLVFMYMISNATSDGICDFTPQCIADATGKPIDLIYRSIKELESDDEMSRTRVDGGRRIRLLDDERPWGWQIINHKMYREIGSRDSMKEAERLRKREYRKKKSKECPGQVPDNAGTAGVGVGDVVDSKEGDSKGETEPTKQTATELRDDEFAACWKLYPNKDGKAQARKAFDKYKPDPEKVIAGIARYIAYVRSQHDNGFPELKYANGSTWFNQQRWESEYEIEDNKPKRSPIPDYYDENKNPVWREDL